mgnify:CR=1 FL=1
MKIVNDTRAVSYHPVLVEPNEDEIILKYIMWIGLGNHKLLDREHLNGKMLKKYHYWNNVFRALVVQFLTT